jgi:hypothetical protein
VKSSPRQSGMPTPAESYSQSSRLVDEIACRWPGAALGCRA